MPAEQSPQIDCPQSAHYAASDLLTDRRRPHSAMATSNGQTDRQTDGDRLHLPFRLRGEGA